MDRGYIDFARLYTFTQQMAFFIVRGKKNLDYGRQAYRSVDKSTGLRSDQKIVLQGPKTSKEYPVALRRITYLDAETKRMLVHTDVTRGVWDSHSGQCFARTLASGLG